MNDKTIVSHELNYRDTHTAIHPTYQLNRFQPQEGLGNYTVSAGQGCVNTFNILPNTLNFSKSKLAFQFGLPAQGAGNFAWINANFYKFIQRIVVQVQGSGAVLMDLSSFDYYLDIIGRRTNTFEDVQTWDGATSYAAVNTATNFYEGLISSNFTGANSTRLDGTAMSKTGQESEYAISCGPTANTAMYVNVVISFDKLKDTILSLDKNIFFGGKYVTLTIYYNPTSAFCWQGTSGTNPSTGAAALTNTTATIVNPTLLLAVEQNKELSEAAKNKAMNPEGFSLKIPYTFGQFQPLPAKSLNPTINYSSGQGSHIKRIWVGFYPTANTNNLTYSKANLTSGAGTISSIQTQLNGTNIQYFPWIPYNSDDFTYNRNKMQGCDILSFNEWLYDWCYLEDFTGTETYKTKLIYPNITDNDIIDGLPLFTHAGTQYNINATGRINLTTYIFTVFIRKLRIVGGEVFAN